MLPVKPDSEQSNRQKDEVIETNDSDEFDELLSFPEFELKEETFRLINFSY